VGNRPARRVLLAKLRKKKKEREKRGEREERREEEGMESVYTETCSKNEGLLGRQVAGYEL